eukprot:scaffold3791_cov390-Prasinococcus_capsulatus_cf.AAC.14
MRPRTVSSESIRCTSWIALKHLPPLLTLSNTRNASEIRSPAARAKTSVEHSPLTLLQLKVNRPQGTSPLTALNTASAKFWLPVDKHAFKNLRVSASATSRTVGKDCPFANSCSCFKKTSRASRSVVQDAACKSTSSSSKLFHVMLWSMLSSTFSCTGSRLSRSTIAD